MTIKQMVTGVAVGVFLLGMMAVPTLADLHSIDFELPTYVVGDIDGQDGWSKTGTYDVEVVSNTYG